jgi:hypothetical protein
LTSPGDADALAEAILARVQALFHLASTEPRDLDTPLFAESGASIGGRAFDSLDLALFGAVVDEELGARLADSCDLEAVRTIRGFAAYAAPRCNDAALASFCARWRTFSA